jgi:hypothetical protein
MARGFKTGGRTQGTPNKRTLELSDRLETAAFDPVQVIIDIAKNAASSPDLRLRAASELLPYLFPRRKAVELTGTGDTPPQSRHEIYFVNPGEV